MSTPAASDRVCPSCNEKKSPKARVCASCRRRANRLGLSVLTHVSAAPATARTPVQNRIYHGKASDLAARRGCDVYDVKKDALAAATLMLGRAVESSTELSELEMERVLEWLDGEIHAAAA